MKLIQFIAFLHKEKIMFHPTGSQPFGAELYLGKLCLSLSCLHLMDQI